jgi:predicted SAM-dependent methyltransferase
MPSQNGLQLHLGCGKRHFPGFVHIDRDPYEHLDYQRDIKDLAIFQDKTVDLIYACHCFNYYDDDDARVALCEWRRVLKPGGRLRLAVPDFRGLVQFYVKSGNLQPLKRLITGYYKGKDHVVYHRAVYDEASLTGVLRECGFSNVKRYDWRETSHAQHDDYSQAYLPHMDKENGIHVSLNVEAW